MNRFKHLIEALADLLQLQSVPAAEANSCTLVIDEQPVSIEWQEKGEQVLIYSVIGQSPADNKASFYTDLLAGNCFYQHTRGASLALEPQSENILLFQSMPLDVVTPQRLFGWLESFINVVFFWQEKLSVALSHEKGSHMTLCDNSSVRV